MSKYLITGGEGFIGGSIKRQVDGIAYDIKSGFDILNEEALEDSAKSMAGIFHCAAKISVPESFSIPDDYYKTNVEGTRSVATIAASLKCKIVFSSSAAVYGETNTIVDEEFPTHPKSPYAENKVDGEVILKESTVPHVALRYFNVYGPGQSPQYAGVITFFIINALKGEEIIIHGDGSQVRDFVFVDDVARANIIAMQHNATSFEVFNIGSGRETTIKELAEMILRLTQSQSKIVYKESRIGDIYYSRADVSKAERILGWKAEVSLEDGLRETIAFYKNKQV